MSDDDDELVGVVKTNDKVELLVDETTVAEEPDRNELVTEGESLDMVGVIEGADEAAEILEPVLELHGAVMVTWTVTGRQPMPISSHILKRRLPMIYLRR